MCGVPKQERVANQKVKWWKHAGELSTQKTKNSHGAPESIFYRKYKYFSMVFFLLNLEAMVIVHKLLPLLRPSRPCLFTTHFLMWEGFFFWHFQPDIWMLVSEISLNMMRFSCHVNRHHQSSSFNNLESRRFKVVQYHWGHFTGNYFLHHVKTCLWFIKSVRESARLKAANRKTDNVTMYLLCFILLSLRPLPWPISHHVLDLETAAAFWKTELR